MVKPLIPEDVSLNPELYGLRRSHRERRGPAIVESDISDEDDVDNKPTRKKKKKYNDEDGFEDGFDDDDDDEDNDEDEDDEFVVSTKEEV